MAKDVFYFTHDFGARNDPKLLAVSRRYGLAGIGLYWCVIEMLYEQGGSLELNSLDSIGYQLHDDDSIINSLVNDFGLFETDGKMFWSESVNKRLDRRAEIAGKRRQAAQNRWKGSEAAKEGQEEVNELEGVNVPLKDEKPTEGKKKGKDVDFNAIVAMYHAECPSFPRIVKVSEARKSKIRIRLEEMKGDFDVIKKVFQKLEASKFCRGDNKNGWKASFDWIFENEKNWVKVYEGNYDNKIGNASAPDNKGVNDIWK